VISCCCRVTWSFSWPMSFPEICSAVDITLVWHGCYKVCLPAKILKSTRDQSASTRVITLTEPASTIATTLSVYFPQLLCLRKPWQGIGNYVCSRCSTNTGVSVVWWCIPSPPLLSPCSEEWLGELPAPAAGCVLPSAVLAELWGFVLKPTLD